MSTLEVNVPMPQADPRPDRLQQHDRCQRLGDRLRHRADHRHRRHRAGQRERRHDRRLAAPRQPHRPVQHRPVVLQRRGRVDVGVHARRRVELVMRQPAAMRTISMTSSIRSGPSE
jgi:hypothetical protein